MEKYKAKIVVSLRQGILDVQGKTIENALHSIDLGMLTNVHIGKYFELDVESETKEQAIEIVKDACNKLIANPIIEDFKIEIV